MKKTKRLILFSMLTLAIGGCSKDNDNNPDSPKDPVSYGIFIVNSGNLYSNIDGSLGYYEYGSGNYFEDIFKSSNDGQSIGDIFNDGCMAGDYIYLAVTNSAVLHVLDREDFKIVKTIRTRSEAGPRHVTSYKGKIYMTLFGQPGYVAEVDPTTLEITREVEVGPLPEGIVGFNDKLYVAVSDGYNAGANASITVIDPVTFKVTDEIKGLVNPVNMLTDGNNVYSCAWGQYQNEYPYSQYNYGVYRVDGNKLSDKLFDATYISNDGNLIYYINAPYGIDSINYGVYDTKTGKTSSWISEENGVDSPIALAADEVSGQVLILSYKMGDYGYPAYNDKGYAKLYKPDGSVVATFDTGISPTNAFFNDRY